MLKILIIILIPFLFFCKEIRINKEDTNSILENLNLLIYRNSRAIVSGTAVKGIVKQGSVIISQLNADGNCNSTPLASSTTDEFGNYSLAYSKTGGVICLTVSGSGNGKTEMFDEKSNSNIPVLASSDFKLVTILPESRLTGNSRKNINASPFSKLLARRLQSLIKESGNGGDVNALYKRASKEVVIRFGLSSGLSSASGKTLFPRAANSTLSDSDYPELDDIIVDLENPSSPLSTKFISILAGFSQLANKYKKGNTVTADDTNAVLEAFALDFEDGAFDGRASNVNSITIGTGTNQLTFSSTPLTTILLPAIVSYVQEGGNLSTGRPNTTPATITTTQITNQTQFADSTPIVSSTGSTSGYTIGGTITGLTGTLVLQNNGSDDTSLTANGNFTFTAAIKAASTYSVTVKTQPVEQTCLVSNGSGVANNTITNVSVSCTTNTYSIGGIITGLTTTGLVLQNNGGDNITLPIGATSFTFPTKLVSGASYSVKVFTQPTGLICYLNLANGAGTITTNVNSISIGCHGTTAIRVYGQGGVFTANAVNNGGLSANSLNVPFSIAVDSSGVYISDWSNSRVLYYSGTSTTATRVYGQIGVFTTSTTNNGGLSASSINQARGIAVDSSGVYLADSGNHRVLYYLGASTTATRVYGQVNFTSGSANQGGGATANTLNNPFGIAVDSTGVYVVENSNNRVVFYPGTSTTATRVYGQGGVFTTSTANNGGITANSLSGPQGISIDSTGVYIADTGNHRVLYYPGTSTTATRVYGQPNFTSNTANNGGITQNSLNFPRAVAAYGGDVFIIDNLNHRTLFYQGTSTTAIRVFGQGGSFNTGSINNPALNADSFNGPQGIAIDASGIYVNDTDNNRVFWY